MHVMRVHLSQLFLFLFFSKTRPRHLAPSILHNIGTSSSHGKSVHE